MMLRNVLAGLGVLAVIGVSAVSISAYNDRSWDDAPPRLQVSFRGLDLATADGIDALDGRVRLAVDRICSRNRGFDLASRYRERQCRKLAFASAQPQIDRAIAEASAGGSRAPEPALLADLDRQSWGNRKSIKRAIVRTLLSGRTANWYGGDGKGFVYAQDRVLDAAGRTCGLVTVTQKVDGEQRVVAGGSACAAPTGYLSFG